MIVKLLVYTGWDKRALKPGDKLDVAPITAKRWQENGIATIVKEQPMTKAAWDGLSLKELRAIAKAKGIKGSYRLNKKELLTTLRNGV